MPRSGWRLARRRWPRPPRMPCWVSTRTTRARWCTRAWCSLARTGFRMPWRASERVSQPHPIWLRDIWRSGTSLGFKAKRQKRQQRINGPCLWTGAWPRRTSLSAGSLSVRVDRRKPSRRSRPAWRRAPATFPRASAWPRFTHHRANLTTPSPRLRPFPRGELLTRAGLFPWPASTIATASPKRRSGC